MTKLIFLSAINCVRYLSCSIFQGLVTQWTTSMCLDSMYLDTVFILFWQIWWGGRWQVIWCLGSHQIIHDVGSLCISTMWLFEFFLLERALKQELQKW